MVKAPDAFSTISEAAEALDIPQHVLRFWETRFPQIKPMKRGGGRRYYRPEDVDLLRGIRYLLYAEGYTIKGVLRILKEHGPGAVQDAWKVDTDGKPEPHREAPDVPAGNPETDAADGTLASPPSVWQSPAAAPEPAESNPAASPNAPLNSSEAAAQPGVAAPAEPPSEPDPARPFPPGVSIVRGGLRRAAAKAPLRRSAQLELPVKPSQVVSRLRRAAVVQADGGALAARPQAALQGVMAELLEIRKVIDSALRRR